MAHSIPIEYANIIPHATLSKKTNSKMNITTYLITANFPIQKITASVDWFFSRCMNID